MGSPCRASTRRVISDISFEADLDITVLVELVMAIEEAGIVEVEFNDNDVMEKAKTIDGFIDLVKLMRNKN